MRGDSSGLMIRGDETAAALRRSCVCMGITQRSGLMSRAGYKISRWFHCGEEGAGW